MFGIPISVILGVVSGFAVNALGVLTSPGGSMVLKLLPSAISLAHTVASGKDARTAAESFLEKVPAALAAKHKPEEVSEDVKAPASTAANKSAKKR